MKKIILLNILLCMGYVLNAQTNWIQNPGFEDAGVVIKKQTTDLMAGGSTGEWVHLLKAKANQGIVEVATDDKYAGTSSLKLVLDEIGERYNFYLAYEMLNLKPSKYTFSFYAKALKSNSLRVEAQGVSTAGIKIEAEGRFLIGSTANGIAETVTNEWKKYTFEVDLSAYDAAQIKFVNLILRPNCLQNGNVNKTPNTYWFDNFEFIGEDNVVPMDDFDKLLNNISLRHEQGTNINNLNNRVEAHLALLIPNGVFSDVNYKDNSETNWEPINHLERVGDFIFAYTMPKTKYFENAELYSKIVSALEAWYAQNPKSKNWWQNQIAVPRSLGLSLVQMRRAERKLSTALENKLIDRMSADAADLATQDGANLTDVATDYFYRACLTKDKAMLELATSSVYQPLSLVESGKEGIQYDLSFHQHGPQLYIGGYGDELIKGVTSFALNTAGTSYAINSKQTDVLSQFVRETYIGALRGQAIQYNAIGRSVSRANGINKSSMSKNIENMLKIDPTHANDYSNAIKRMKKEEPAEFKVEAQNKFYPQSDYVVHTRPSYSFSVRAVSERTSIIENGNGENLRSYFMTFGASALMLDGNEYFDIFPVWNWNRVPGVTGPQMASIPVRPSWGIFGTAKFVGGASDNMYAVMAYSHKDNIGEEVTAAQKSWFFFDDEIVSLGAGINSTSTSAINTSLEQSLSAGNVTIYNNKSEVVLSKGSEQTYDETATWVHHNNVGYVFPAGGKLTVSNKTQKGTWKAINSTQSDAQVEKDVFSLYLDHGIKPTKGTYAYILLPNKKVADVKSYKADNIEIVKNTADMQAVVHKGLNICQVVFYKAGVFEYQGLSIASDKPSVVMLRDFKSAKAKLVVADPTQSKAKVTIKTTFPQAPDEPILTVADFTAEKTETAGVSKVIEIETPSSIVYGKNLIKNPSFEEEANLPENLAVHPTSGQFADQWNLTVTTADVDKGDISVAKDVAQHGQNSMKINLEQISARYRFYATYDILEATPGVYEFSFFTKANVEAVPFRVEVASFNALGTAYDKGIDLLFNDKNAVGVEKQTTSDWAKHSFSLDLSAKTKEDLKVVRIFIRPNCNQGGNPTKKAVSYWFDNFVFREVMEGKDIESIDLSEELKNGLKFVEGDAPYNLLEPLLFTLNPKGAYLEDVVYTVDKTDVVEIKEGIVTIKKAGTATIYLSSAKNPSIKSDPFSITVDAKSGCASLESITLLSTLKNGLKFILGSDGLSLVDGNKLTLIGEQGYSIVDKFLLDPADHPLADLKFTSSNAAVATISEEGLIVFGNELGFSDIVISSRLQPKVKSDVFRITVEKSGDAKVHSLLINGKSAVLTNDSYTHLLVCGDDRDVSVEIEIEKDASIDIDKSFVVKLGETPDVQIIRFSVVPSNGDIAKKKSYTLNFVTNNFMDHTNIIVQKFNKRLIVNNNSKTNGGFTFTKYFWSIDGIESEGKQIYSTGDKELSATSDYGLRLISMKDNQPQELNVCPFNIQLKAKSSIAVYPNPAIVGEVLNIKATMPEGTDYNNSRVEVYSMSGNMVKTSKLSGEETQLQTPATSGLYVVKVVCDGYSNEFKVIVK